MDRMPTIPHIIALAKQKLEPSAWDYGAGGSDTETTLRTNLEAIERIRFRPRILRDVRGRSTKTQFLGVPLDLPVMLAPVGTISMFDEGGALTAARAAHTAGTASVVGTLATPSLEEVAKGSPGPLFFQLYVRGDRAWLRNLVQRVEQAGYNGIFVTVDSAVYSRRERDLNHGFVPKEARESPNLHGAPERREFQEMLSWADIAWLRELTKLPIILKGVMTAEDAELAVEHGVQGVCVSNHGGRQLDYLPGTLEVLPEIAARVAGRLELVVDGGFTRGTDVVKAIALGASVVMIGKLQCWGLAAGGQAGLERVLELLRLEISNTMGLLGVTELSALGPAYLSAVR